MFVVFLFVFIMFSFVSDSVLPSLLLILTLLFLANLSAIAVLKPSFEINISRPESRVSLSEKAKRSSTLVKSVSIRFIIRSFVKPDDGV